MSVQRKLDYCNFNFLYIQSIPICQAFVHGDSLEATLVVIVTPDLEAFVPWCNGKGISGDDAEQLATSKDVKKMVLDDMNSIGKRLNLKGFELAKQIFIDPEPWTVESGLMTPTFKSKRPQLRSHYSDQIKGMYNQ